MRKALVLTVSLFLLSIVGLTAAHISINPARDKVVLTEHVIYGDKSAAKGLTAHLSVHQNYQLYWDTSYHIGDEAVTDTDFSFSAVQKSNDSYSETLGMDLNSEMRFRYINGTEDEASSLTLAFKELSDATPLGAAGEAVIDLKDYYDYYPISGNITLPDGAVRWRENDIYMYNTTLDGAYIAAALNDFFKIPVLDEHQLTIGIDKRDGDETSNSRSLSSTGSDAFYLLSDYGNSVITDDAFYFTFDCHTETGELVDTSLIPGGFGIYCLPYSTDKKGNTTSIDVDELAMVYELNPEMVIYDFSLNADKTRLMLHAEEDGKYVFTVIDLADMSTVQKLEICDWPEDNYFRLYNGDGYFVTLFSGDKLAVVRITDSGEYELCYTTAVSEDDPRFGSTYSTTAFDGERIALMDRYRLPYDENLTLEEHNGPNRNTSCAFTLAVYDSTGLLYAGNFTNNLDTKYVYFAAYCISENPYSLSWEN